MKIKEFGFFKAWQNNSQASIVVDADFKIMGMNDSFKAKFAAICLVEDEQMFSLFEKMTSLVWLHKKLPSDMTTALIYHQNDLFKRIILTSFNELIAIPIAYFIIENDELRSKHIYITPIFNELGKCIGLQLIVTEYTMWGNFNAFSAEYNIPKSVYNLKLVDVNHKPPISLTDKQYTILLLLTHGYSLHKCADILNLSYGNIAKTVNDSIATKFGVDGGDLNVIIDKANSLGYKTFIPQLLCRPFIVVLDDLITQKYSLE